MNIEDLKLDDIVEAKCLGCGEMHKWAVHGLNMAPRVILHIAESIPCASKRQLVYAAGIERVVV